MSENLAPREQAATDSNRQLNQNVAVADSGLNLVDVLKANAQLPKSTKVDLSLSEKINQKIEPLASVAGAYLAFAHSRQVLNSDFGKTIANLPGREITATYMPKLPQDHEVLRDLWFKRFDNPNISYSSLLKDNPQLYRRTNAVEFQNYLDLMSRAEIRNGAQVALTKRVDSFASTAVKTIGLGLAINYGINRVFFDKDVPGALTYGADIASPMILFSGFSPKAKLGVIVGSHIVAKVLEHKEQNAAADKRHAKPAF